LEIIRILVVNIEDMPQDLLKSMKKNASDTVSVGNARLKAYQDSLNIYNKSNKLQKDLKARLTLPWSELKKYNSLDDIVKRNEKLKKNKIKPIGETSPYYVKDDDGKYASHPKHTNKTIPVYKKPTKPENTPEVVTSESDPRLKKYQDSLTAYNKSNDLYKQLLKQGKEGNQGIREQVRDKMALEEVNYRGNVGMPFSYEGIKPDYVLGTRTPKENKGYLPHYKKPVQPIKYQKSEDIQSTPLSLMKKPEVIVKKQNNYDEGESIMLRMPDRLGGGGGAFIGTKKKDGTVEYVKPEDFKRMGVPPYGQEFILNQLAKKDEK